MLQRLWTLRTGNRHQDAFLARYDQVLKWARQFSAKRPWQAEDLAQDAYIQFMAIRPDLDDIRNLDAYLYAIVRNLHRSMRHRNLQLRQVSLSILDFDRIEDCLKLIEKEYAQGVLEDLESIRAFACDRRETSKIGSLLILRFFHGYSVEETARLMGVNRAALDSGLLRARREAREYLAHQRAGLSGKLLQLTSETHVAKRTPFPDRYSTDPVTILLNRIFESVNGPCRPPAELKSLYAEISSNGIDNKALAHIVCCRACLELAVHYSRIESTDQKSPDGPDSGPPAREESGSRGEKLRRVRDWDREFQRLLEHQPQELRITVNGVPLASQPVVGGRGELTISVPLAERIEFIEVLSEQEVRLLMLPVLLTPPEGEYEQAGELDFGDGRILSIRIAFDDPWPTVHVQYGEAQTVPAGESAAGFAFGLPSVRHPASSNRESLRSLLGWLWHPVSRWSLRLCVGALPVLLIMVLLFVQTHENTASAAALVERMETWQRTAAQRGAVLHRSFDFIERDKRSAAIGHRRVEVWRRSPDAARISRLIDDSGAIIASTRIAGPPPLLTAANAWQFDPAPDTYRALVGDLGNVRVERGANEFELISPAVRLKVEAGTYAPTGETIDTPDKSFEFREQLTESEPERFSPFAAEPPATHAVLHAPRLPPMKTDQPSAPAVTDADLEATEVFARMALHRVNADMGEQLRIHRDGQEIEVAGVVDSARRKSEMEAALEGLAHVRVSLLSPDDLAGVSDTNARTVAALQSPPLPVAQESPAILEPWLKQEYPNPNDRLAFVNRITELARECLGHAHALKELADRYETLNAPGIRPIARDHIVALEKSWGQLSALTSPAVGIGTGGPAGTPVSAGAANAAKLLESLNELNRCLLRLFTQHSSFESDGSENQLQIWRRLSQDADTVLAALAGN